MRRAGSVVCLCLALVALGGCGLALNSSPYAYRPSEPVTGSPRPLPLTVAVTPLVDARGSSNRENLALLSFPFVPYATSHYDRPERERKFAVKRFRPEVDLGLALMQEIRQNGLFREVVPAREGEPSADLILTGTVRDAGVDTTVTFYGMSYFGMLPWIAGLPQGKVYNRLDVEYELKRGKDGKVVWRYGVKGERSRIFGFYYHYADDEPYTGINEMLRKGLHDAVVALARETREKPLEYWREEPALP